MTSLKMQRILIVEEYGSAYTLDENDNLLFQTIGNFNQIYYSFNIEEGGNIHDDWTEVDMDLFGDEFDYQRIIRNLK